MIIKNQQKTIQMSKEYTRTHGIEIAHQIVDHPIAKQAIQQQGHLDLSVWDFAGQHEYYNNHHYFLQSRSIFLILYKLNEQRDSEKGLKGLSFWFKSLSCSSQTRSKWNLKPSLFYCRYRKKDQQNKQDGFVVGWLVLQWDDRLFDGLFLFHGFLCILWTSGLSC